jgi:hypothetical protein
VREFLAGLGLRFGKRGGESERKPQAPIAPLPGPVEEDARPPIVRRPVAPPAVPPPKVELPRRADPRPSGPLPTGPSPLEEIVRPWLAAKLAALLVAFGLPGGIAGVGGAAIAWLVMRRGRKKLEAELQRLRARLGEAPADQAPVGATEVRHHNRFVPFEVTELDRAWSAAHARVGEKYPGAVPYLKIVESVKDQLLSGVEESELES